MIETAGGSANCLAPGVHIGEYRLLDVVGEGGFGIVYRARDVSLDRIVAIKEYMPATLVGRKSSNEIHVRSQHRGAFDAGLRSFINEARLLAKFSHPALVHVYRFFELNGTAYMVMRHYEGQTFRTFLNAQQERMNQRMLAAIVGPILDVVEMLHAADCYHRDIAPDNVFLQNSGMPVLLDFGAARRIIGDMTQALTMVLKPGFAPIEQYVDDGAMPQGAWTDIYQIGAMLYLAITGKPPATSVARMINDPVVALSPTDYPGYSSQFLRGVGQALAVKPQDRPQTIAALKELLGITTFTMPMHAPWHDAVPGAQAVTSSLSHPTLPASDTTGLRESLKTTGAATEANASLPFNNSAERAQHGPIAAMSSLAHPTPPQATVATDNSHIPQLDPQTSSGPSTGTSTAAPQPTEEPSAQKRQDVEISNLRHTRKRTLTLRWATAALALCVATGLAFWLTKHDGGARHSAEDIALNLEDQHWKEAQAAGSVAMLDSYLSAYPKGKHRSEAMALIGRLEVQEPVVSPPPAAVASVPTQAVVAATPVPAASAPPATTTQKAVTAATPTPPPKADPAVADSGVAAKSSPKTVAEVGRVVLRVSPWGRISVNGNSLGTTPPLTSIELPEGLHRIDVSNPAAASVSKTVQVKKGEPVVISHQFE
jgi:serine/threonine protein kinase